jgi:two-component system LytT family response regulator
MSERIGVLLVDDEAPARSLLREYLGAHADIDVLGECANGFEAVKAIAEKSPALVFLDVQMPKLDGFEVLELLDPDARTGGSPAVIFCTAYDEYALKAFEVHAVDYLLKPFGRERLAEALSRARERMAFAAARAAAPEPPVEGVAHPTAGSAERSRAAAIAATARGPGRFAERIVVRDGAQVHVIPVERIEFVEAQDDYVEIHEASAAGAGRTHLKHQPLAELAGSLDPARFVRVHRSYVANVERIARIELLAKDQRVAVLHDGRQLPVSRTGHDRLKELLG